LTLKSIIYRVADGIAVITLNRPEVRNALNEELVEELEELLQDIDGDPGIKVVVVAGQEKFFSVGADIRTLKKLSEPVQAHLFCAKIQRTIGYFENIAQPTIAAVSGLALGGGCEIALACNLRLAAENAVFGQPEINLGIIPGAGGTQRLPRTVGLTVAAELLLTGRTVKADEALRIGLVNRVVPVGELMDEAMKMAGIIAAKPRFAVKMTKSCIREGMQMDISQALFYEARCFDFLASTEDVAEGLSAFIEKRKPIFVGK
jgi:enoyl-CoA hydratase/carnithine racemase